MMDDFQWRVRADVVPHSERDPVAAYKAADESTRRYLAGHLTGAEGLNDAGFLKMRLVDAKTWGLPAVTIRELELRCGRALASTPMPASEVKEVSMEKPPAPGAWLDEFPVDGDDVELESTPLLKALTDEFGAKVVAARRVDAPEAGIAGWRVTVYETLDSASPKMVEDAERVVDWIRRPPSKRKALVEAVRSAATRAEANALKAGLPVVQWGAEAAGRGAEGVLKPSGLIYLDVDGDGTGDVEAGRAALTSCPHVAAVFLSAGGRGFGALVAAPDWASARAALRDVLKGTGFAVDARAKDGLTRVNFMSFDRLAAWNRGAVPAPLVEPDEKPEKKPEERRKEKASRIVVRAEPSLADRIDFALDAILRDCVGRYPTGCGTRNACSRMIAACAMYVERDARVFAALFDLLERQGRFDHPSKNRAQFERVWHTGGSFTGIKMSTFPGIVSDYDTTGRSPVGGGPVTTEERRQADALFD